MKFGIDGTVYSFVGNIFIYACLPTGKFTYNNKINKDDVCLYINENSAN